MALSAFLLVVLLVFAFGVAVGSLGTALAFMLSRPRIVEHTIDATSPRDSSNPYAPSHTLARVTGTRLGCGLVTLIAFLFGLALLGVLMWFGARAAAPVRVTPAAPPTSSTTAIPPESALAPATPPSAVPDQP